MHMVVNVNGMSLIGVFDGVGGWADLGIDPALYAREMAAVIEKELRRAPEQCRKEERPLIMLLQAVRSSRQPSSVAHDPKPRRLSRTLVW